MLLWRFEFLAQGVASALPRLQNLEALCIDQLLTAGPAGLAICSVVAGLPRLHELSARGAYLTDERLELLSHADGCALLILQSIRVPLRWAPRALSVPFAHLPDAVRVHAD